jgi:hypothetical protein
VQDRRSRRRSRRANIRRRATDQRALEAPPTLWRMITPYDRHERTITVSGLGAPFNRDARRVGALARVEPHEVIARDYTPVKDRVHKCTGIDKAVPVPVDSGVVSHLDFLAVFFASDLGASDLGARSRVARRSARSRESPSPASANSMRLSSASCTSPSRA